MAKETDNLEKIKQEFKEKCERARSLDQLKNIEAEILGKKGIIRELLERLRGMEETEKKKSGAEINGLKAALKEEVERKKKELGFAVSKEKDWFDVSAPGEKIERGHLHPLTKTVNEIVEIFGSIGFGVAEGPEIETEWNNFDALNIPKDHPAREMWDTFWIKQNAAETEEKNKAKPKLLLRTHTSPVQIRYMKKNNPPFRIISPGHAYRYEATDASHDFQFYQLEGLMVGNDISIANFKSVIKIFLESFLKKETNIRLRPSYFPFVEPGFELDMSCNVCQGKGCGVCKQTGFVELGGAGMVHPNVFKAVGYNPKEWQGFAFGFGVERLAMMKHKISDIRLFRSGDLRFLKQFS